MLKGQVLLLGLALSFSIAAGVAGCIALMKRMLLAADVISHLALPGIGVALLFKMNPIVGGAATLFVGTILIWQVQRKTGLTTESAVGVIFAAALALGAAVTPSEDLAESLFGQLGKLSVTGFVLGVAGVLVVVVSFFMLRDQLSMSILSPDLAATTGVNISRLDLLFLLLFSLTVLIGLHFMGALLASALIIMPAATARQLTETLGKFVAIATVDSFVSVAAGFLINMYFFHFSTAGPTIAIFAAILFGASLVAKKALRIAV